MAMDGAQLSDLNARMKSDGGDKLGAGLESFLKIFGLSSNTGKSFLDKEVLQGSFASKPMSPGAGFSITNSSPLRIFGSLFAKFESFTSIKDQVGDLAALGGKLHFGDGPIVMGSGGEGISVMPMSAGPLPAMGQGTDMGVA